VYRLSEMLAQRERHLEMQVEAVPAQMRREVALLSPSIRKDYGWRTSGWLWRSAAQLRDWWWPRPAWAVNDSTLTETCCEASCTSST
jgi:hypothetical protein